MKLARILALVTVLALAIGAAVPAPARPFCAPCSQCHDGCLAIGCICGHCGSCGYVCYC